MSGNNGGIFEVLSPWADADPVPPKGISSRMDGLEGKTIGLFRNSKRAAPLILKTLQDRLSRKYPTIKFSNFTFMPNDNVIESEDKAKFEAWLREVDGIVFAYGD
jgi:hypothetical protein